MGKDPKKVQKYASPALKYEKKKTSVRANIDGINIGSYNTPKGKGQYSVVSGDVDLSRKVSPRVTLNGHVGAVRTTDSNPMREMKKVIPNIGVSAKINLTKKKKGGAKNGKKCTSTKK